MATIKKALFIQLCCLTLSAYSHTEPKIPVGKITQLEGSATFFAFMAPYRTQEVKTKDTIVSGGSYLTSDASYFTVKLIDGSWLRVSPRTKFSITQNPEQKTIVVHLFTGSIKGLFSSTLNKGAMEKLIINAPDASFETSEAKFSVVRNILNSETSVYVEKGLVTAMPITSGEKRDMALVHAQETVSLIERKADVPVPRKMNEKEVKWLHSKFYLKSAQGQKEFQ